MICNTPAATIDTSPIMETTICHVGGVLGILGRGQLGEKQYTPFTTDSTAMVPILTRNNPRLMSVRIARVFLRIMVIPSLNVFERFSVVLCSVSADELFGHSEKDEFS